MEAAITPHLAVPSQEELNARNARFRAEWGVVDDVLYRLCREHPNHDSPDVVAGKVALIERAYAAGLERQVEFHRDKHEQPIVVAGRFVTKHGHQVDEILAPLRTIPEPLDGDSMALIVEQHGLLVDLLRGVTRNGALSPRSFASKYLHFHCPPVPIYDEYARQRLTKLVRWDGAQIAFPRPASGDHDYWDYCVRFLRLYQACVKEELLVRTKTLDAYLWAIPE